MLFKINIFKYYKLSYINLYIYLLVLNKTKSILLILIDLLNRSMVTYMKPETNLGQIWARSMARPDVASAPRSECILRS
jgi:hypothetical protein